MACCGKSNSVSRVQAIPQKTRSGSVRSQKINLKPPATMRVFVNNIRTGETSAAPTPQSRVNKPADKCPVCSHPVMINRVGGRPRYQCTNFSCRHILQ